LLPGCRSGEQSPPVTSAPVPTAELLTVEVLDVRPHDPEAFTQGLEMSGGSLYESTGRYGYSQLREVDPVTGEVLRSADLPGTVFGEGLTFSNGEIVVLTWQSGRVFRFDPVTFTVTGEFTIEGSGWGVCRAGDRVITSDGSSILTFRDPATFEPTGSVQVTMDGVPQVHLNELEYHDGMVYANKWQTPFVLRIDPSDGTVTGLIDATELLETVSGPGVDVLNGVAWSPADGAFLMTGKLWPSMFLVEIVPVSR
jgi:glutamine cyclotransferase